MKNTELLKRQLLADLTERVTDQTFDYVMNVIQAEVDAVFGDDCPDWIKEMDDEDQQELQYELCSRIAVSYE